MLGSFVGIMLQQWVIALHMFSSRQKRDSKNDVVDLHGTDRSLVPILLSQNVADRQNLYMVSHYCHSLESISSPGVSVMMVNCWIHFLLTLIRKKLSLR